ncbi:hypothetical protein ACFVUW_11255 [Streptomyces xiamenensis]|uniref:hypothetical protein n=1 Tax=Streptomyces xiamenensis TaxID=408015 RepID=UPI0036EBC0D6
MYRIRPVANGSSTDHPIPGLPFINDGRLPLDNPDAIERTGRRQGEGLWGRTDETEGDGWVAFTTEPKNRSFAWAVFHHPPHGRTVLLIRDDDQSSLHHVWKYGGSGFLHRHGGYWWDGEHWHRPGQVQDAAFERYDPRPVSEPMTVTAADLLVCGGNPEAADIMKIASFTAREGVSNWADHLALWAQLRASQPGQLPLESCVVDLRAPELERGLLVDRAGLAEVAGISIDDVPDPQYGRRDLPEPQYEAEGVLWWSVPVAQDWAEDYRRYNGPAALLSTTTVGGRPQPLGRVADHNQLRDIFHGTLTEQHTAAGKKRRPYLKEDLAYGAAEDLAADAAGRLMYGHNQGLVPHGLLRDVLVDSIIGRLAEDVEARAGKGKSPNEIILSDMPRAAIELLTWYIKRRPNETAYILGDICLVARSRLGLHPAKIGRLFRRSFSLDSDLDGKTVEALLDMALPPSARDYRTQF